MSQHSIRQRFLVVTALSIVVVLLSAPCPAQEPYLVKDISDATVSPGLWEARPEHLVAVGDVLFYQGCDEYRGCELWRSDGTSTGTHIVADIIPDVVGSFPFELTEVDGTLFFGAQSGGILGKELWKSDGTEAGTAMVKDINPIEDAYLMELTEVNGTLFFVADDGTNWLELWKSDGTEAGTVMVKDINPVSGSLPTELTEVNGTLFFNAIDELWKSDGTEAGTVMVKDINPAGYSQPSNLADVNGTLFFTADDGTNGRELWKSDGTEAGTMMIKDINPVGGDSYPTHLTDVNGTLFFRADDGTNGRELWKSDGTEAGTVMVKDINPAGSSSASNLTDVNGMLFLAANDGISSTLWKSDGTGDGTVMVKDINPAGSSGVGELTDVGGTLFFRADDGTNGRELWKSDGTELGTVMVKDINPTGVSSLSALTDVGGTLFFSAEDGYGNLELWKSNGTEISTVMVRDTRLTKNSDPEDLTDFNGTLFFTAWDETNGQALWRSEGFEYNTVVVKGDLFPSGLMDFEETLFFGANDGTNGTELWKSDGTEAGTVMVKDINPSGSSSPSRLVEFNGRLFFGADDDTNGNELWESDGTEAGTLLVKNINPTGSSSPSRLTDVNGALFLYADDGTNGAELWKSDGTEAGTVMVKDINPAGDSSLWGLTDVDGTLFFIADDGTNGAELWKSDGTEAGTVMVKEINLTGFSWVNGLTEFNGELYFSAYEPIKGQELWKSDGTEAGTVMVKDIRPGSGGSGPSFLTVFDGQLFFIANDGTNLEELWKSDGTAAGTVMVKDINPEGTAFLLMPYLTEFNGELYFSAYDPINGQELWKSDGTEAGTSIVADIFLGIWDSSPEYLTATSERLFFAAKDMMTGVELWAMRHPRVDLVIHKTDDETEEIPGTEVEYTILVTNNHGPDDALGATVVDTFPAELTDCTWTCAPGGGGVCTPAGSGNINDVVDLPNGSWLTYTATCTVHPAATGSLSNTATVAVPAGFTDYVPSNNSATDVDTLSPTADLGITKDDGQTTAVAGEPISYTIVASNFGPSDAPGVSVSDLFRAALESCSWTCTPAGGAACTASGTGDISDLTDLPAGGTATYVASCTVALGAVGTISNTATMGTPAGVTDPGPASNAANDQNTVISQADLGIAKTNHRREIVETHQTSYAIVVWNNGPSYASGIQVDDIFPPELTDCSWICEPLGASSCTPSGTGDIADVIDLGMSEWVVYTGTCTVASSSGTCDNTATVTPPAGVTDPDPTYDTSTDSDHITALADFIFENGFEDGSTAGWSSTVPPIMLKEIGREVRPDQHRVAFRLDLETLEPLGRFEAPVAAGHAATGELIYLLSLRRSGEGFAVRARAWRDDGSSAVTEWVALPSPFDDIELRWIRSLPGLADGRVELYVDGLPPEVIEYLVNENRPLAGTARGVTVDGIPVTQMSSFAAEEE